MMIVNSPLKIFTLLLFPIQRKSRLKHSGTRPNWFIKKQTTNSVSILVTNKPSLYQSTITLDHSISPSLAIVAGTQVQNKSIRSNDRGNHDVKQLAAFTLLNKRVGQNLNLAPAIRVDYDERAGTELVSQIN